MIGIGLIYIYSQFSFQILGHNFPYFLCDFFWEFGISQEGPFKVYHLMSFKMLAVKLIECVIFTWQKQKFLSSGFNIASHWSWCMGLYISGYYIYMGNMAY